MNSTTNVIQIGATSLSISVDMDYALSKVLISLCGSTLFRGPVGCSRQPQPDSAQFNNFGATHGAVGNYRAAREQFTKAIELSPQLPEAYFNRAHASFCVNDFADAIADLDQAIRLDPKRSDFYLHRGDALERSGDFNSAIADYDRAIQLDARSTGAYCSRGYSKGQRGDYLGAINDFTRAINLIPTND